MPTITTERRICSRRNPSRGGGRRFLDPPREAGFIPPCPQCRTAGDALLAGEGDGGWWFVCLACDHLWNARSQMSETELLPDVISFG